MFSSKCHLLAALFLWLLYPANAGAVCTGAVSVTTTSTSLLALNDISPRSVLFIQNSGATNDMYCAIGTTNAATTSNGFLIAHGGGYLMFPTTSSPSGGPGGEVLHNVPGGDVACITAAGSTVAVFCDY